MKTHSLCVLVALFSFLTIILAGCSTFSKKYPAVTYTESQYKEFWGAHIRQLVVQKKLESPELSLELDHLLEVIRLKYGKDVSVHLNKRHCALSVDAMDAYVTNGMPVVEISLPYLMDVRDRCMRFRGEADAEERYRTFFVIYYFHQLYRLGFGHVAPEMAGRRNSLVTLRHQRATWPITITNVVELFASGGNSQLPVLEDELTYKAWLIAKDSESPELWDVYLKARYATPP